MVVPAAPPALPAPVVPDVVEPLEVPAAPELLCWVVESDDEGETVPVTEPPAAPIPDVEPDAEPVPAHAARAKTQARGKTTLITFSSLTKVVEDLGKRELP